MIYIIRLEGTNFVKIGFTQYSVENRIKALQSANPHKIEIIASMPGDMKKEKATQDKYREYSYPNGGSREWFYFPDSVIEELKKLNNPPYIPVTIKKRKKELTDTINIRCSPADLERLKWLSNIMEISQGEIIRNLISLEYESLST